MPTTGWRVPSAGPLQEDFQVLPSPSTVVSVYLAVFSVSVTMTKVSLFIAGPEPKLDSPRLRVQVLGVGRWVFAASAKGVSMDGSRTADTRREERSIVDRSMVSPED